MKVTLVLFILFSIFLLIIPETSQMETGHTVQNINNSETLILIRRKRYEYLWFCAEIYVKCNCEFRIERADLIWGSWIKGLPRGLGHMEYTHSPAGQTLRQNDRKLICACGQAGLPSGTEGSLQINSNRLQRPWIIKWDRSFLRPAKLIDWDYDHNGMYVDHQVRDEYWHTFYIYDHFRPNLNFHIYPNFN